MTDAELTALIAARREAWVAMGSSSTPLKLMPSAQRAHFDRLSETYRETGRQIVEELHQRRGRFQVGSTVYLLDHDRTHVVIYRKNDKSHTYHENMRHIVSKLERLNAERFAPPPVPKSRRKAMG